MKPCVHQTPAGGAAALAVKGRAKDPAAATARELRSTDRRLRFPMSVLLPARAPRGPSAGALFLATGAAWPRPTMGSTSFITLLADHSTAPAWATAGASTE